jgi:hypothetical protein
VSSGREKSMIHLQYAKQATSKLVCLLHAGGLLAYSLTLKLEALHSSEMLVCFCQLTQPCIPDNCHILSHQTQSLDQELELLMNSYKS